MAVDVDQPQIGLTLRKNIGRTSLSSGGASASERFSGQKREIDISGFLGEGSSVTTQHSVRAPAGMFSITVVDKMVNGDSLYGLVEPQDVIDIRMARDVSRYDSSYPGRMPIIMRGFVSEVTRERVMTKQGPVRTVTITGQDYGKILQILRIIYLPNMLVGQDLLTNYNLLLNFGVDVREFTSAADFITEMVSKVVLPFLAKMRSSGGGGSAPAVLDIGVEATVSGGKVSPFGPQEFEGGSVYDLMKLFGDVGAFNELFMEDREDGPYLVYRPLPFKDVNGSPIQGAAAASLKLRDEDVISESQTRSDSDVANYFWVNAARYSLINPSVLQGVARSANAPNVVVDDHPNASPNFYGVRLLEVETNQGERIDGLSADAYSEGSSSAVEAIAAKRKILVDTNKDNVVFERGSMVLKGDERVRAGMYLKIARGVSGAQGNLQTEHYAHRVTQQYVWGRNFLTNVEYDRGTGFIERAQMGSGSFQRPYLAELSMGGTYAPSR